MGHVVHQLLEAALARHMACDVEREHGGAVIGNVAPDDLPAFRVAARAEMLDGKTRRRVHRFRPAA